MYSVGHIKPWWTIEHRSLNYQQKPFNNPNDLNMWLDQGYALKECIGWTHIVKCEEWAKPFFTLFSGTNVGVTIFKMTTFDILPHHRDIYEFYRKLYNVSDPSKIYRAIIFLEDWKSGHLFEIESKLFSKWSAGDYVLWNHDALHMAANLGLEDRYTAQITYTHV